MLSRFFLSLFIVFFSIGFVTAQEETVVRGRVFEKGKQDPIPFVSIGFKGTTTGVTSDFEGYFELRTTKPVDTLLFSYIGYKTQRIKIRRGQTQELTIEMIPDHHELSEVVVRPGENPALRIVREAQKRREQNDQESLDAFEFDSYNKINVSMNNISEKMKNNKMFAPIKDLLDTSNQVKNEEGKYILPIFISETYSKFYQNNHPSAFKEVVHATNMNGFGVEQGSYVVDLVGTSVLQFDFNQNWIRFLAKDFMSPIASGSMGYYIYTLLDSEQIDGYKCYKIKLNLRREEDLGFLGTMWITDSSFAIKRIQVELAPSANLNFIDRLKIQQEMIQTSQGPWVTSKTRAIIDIAQMTENTTGFIAKMYRSNTNYKINEKKPASFYDVQMEREQDLFDKDSLYWRDKRTESFSSTEKQMFNMIDSVKNLPAVKTYLDVIRLVLEGYYRVGKLDWGPYLFLVGYNEVEQLRFRIGFRTNQHFSKNWYLRSYIAYGLHDEKFKYGFGIDRIISHKHWTTFGLQFKNDYDILGITDPSVAPLQGGGRGNAFAALSFAVPGSRINHTIDYRAVFLTNPKRDWTFRVTAQNTYFEPLGSFIFAYKTNPYGGESSDNLKESFTYTAFSLEARYAYKEMMISRGIDRVRMVMPKAPAITVSYSRGVKDLLGGEFNFDKLQLNIEQHITTGKLGNADYSITTGKILGQLPYPILDVARGNATIIYSDRNYSLMNLYEFIADEYTHFAYIQHFEGLFTNRLPLLGKWKWRNYALVKTSYGHLSLQNRSIIPNVNESGQTVSPVYTFKDLPYTEVGYGFENILRFVSIGMVHRLTYLNNVNVRKWGVNVGITITF